MFAAGKTAAVSGGAPDEKFNYVTMLLHGDGTNGAQNNTFIDSSGNGFTCTRNGNPTQGTFSPYGQGWSNFFDGVGDYLANTSTALITAAVSTFTVEAWIFMTANPTSDANNLGSIIALDGEPANTTNYLSFGPISTRKLRIRWFDGASKYAEGSTTLSLNNWYHVAVVVNSNAITMYVNGVAETLSGTTTLTNRSGTAGQFSIGAHYYSTFWGYLSNLRVTTTAVYTGAFTPSTTPLTNITNTKILTCQSNRFVDNSSNAYALTVGGTPSVQRFNPFGTSTEYSTATIGGSGYFDGSSDYLSAISGGTALTFGTGDFTVEGWVYPTVAATNGLLQISGATTGLNASVSNSIAVFQNAGTWQIYAANGARDSAAYTNNLNCWYHFACVRFSGTTKLYVNGVEVITQADTTNYTGSYMCIGAAYQTAYLADGYLSNIRVVKGTAVYTSAFTPPTTPVTAISGTSLLYNMTNGAIYDNAMMNDLETVGNAQISTSVKKYGTGSIAFNGSTDYLKIDPTGYSSLNFGTGNFTLEMWVYPTSYSNKVLIDARPTAGAYVWLLEFDASGKVRFNANTTTVTTSVALTSSTWSHVAVVRSGSTLTIYINGVSRGSGTVTETLTSGTGARIGSDLTGGSFFGGYIDDLRITKGYARYTTNFTPPTAALPDKGPI